MSRLEPDFPTLCFGGCLSRSSHNDAQFSAGGGKALDDGSKPGFADLKATKEETLFPGRAACCLPDDIHSVVNNGSRVAVSLHTYGRHLNHTGRSTFDVEAKTETPLFLKIEE